MIRLTSSYLLVEGLTNKIKKYVIDKYNFGEFPRRELFMEVDDEVMGTIPTVITTIGDKLSIYVRSKDDYDILMGYWISGIGGDLYQMIYDKLTDYRYAKMSIWQGVRKSSIGHPVSLYNGSLLVGRDDNPEVNTLKSKSIDEIILSNDLRSKFSTIRITPGVRMLDDEEYKELRSSVISRFYDPESPITLLTHDTPMSDAEVLYSRYYGNEVSELYVLGKLRRYGGHWL